MKATPTTIASDSNDISTASVSKASDIMMMSSSQKEDPSEGKTTAIVAVMRSRPNIVTTANTVTSTTNKN